MKKWSKKVWLSAVALVIAIMSVSAIPASADVSRVIWFTIQNNTVCASGNVPTTFFLNLNNISVTESNVSIHFYNDVGAEVMPTGFNGNGMSSTFAPGYPFTLLGKSTVHYYAIFGGATGDSCSDRPAFGKIVIGSDSGLLMANGAIRGYSNSNSVTYNDTPLIINGGQPF